MDHHGRNCNDLGITLHCAVDKLFRADIDAQIDHIDHHRFQTTDDDAFAQRVQVAKSGTDYYPTYRFRRRAEFFQHFFGYVGGDLGGHEMLS